MSKIYTRLGDEGMTNTLSGERITKCDCLIIVNGNIDSLQASIEKNIMCFDDNEENQLNKIYSKLHQLGGELSEHKIGKLITNPINKKDVEELELWIRELDIKIKGFQRFTKIEAIELNESRVRTRQLERTLTQYLQDAKVRTVAYEYINRLSSYFFAFAVSMEIERCVNCGDELTTDESPCECGSCLYGKKVFIKK